MNALSLRLPSSLVQKTDVLAKTLKMTKTAYIRQALEAFNQANERKLYEQQLKRSVLEVREQTLSALADFENANEDGLHGY